MTADTQVCISPVTASYECWRCIIRPRIEGFYTGEEMAAAQLEYLSEEWSLYTKFQKQFIIMEFLETVKDGNGYLLEFLKIKPEIEGYWKKVGLP